MRTARRAFSLLEMITMLVVMGVLAALAVPAFTQASANISVIRDEAVLVSLATAAQAQARYASTTVPAPSDFSSALSSQAYQATITAGGKSFTSPNAVLTDASWVGSTPALSTTAGNVSVAGPYSIYSAALGTSVSTTGAAMMTASGGCVMAYITATRIQPFGFSYNASSPLTCSGSQALAGVSQSRPSYSTVPAAPTVTLVNNAPTTASATASWSLAASTAVNWQVKYYSSTGSLLQTLTLPASTTSYTFTNTDYYTPNTVTVAGINAYGVGAISTATDTTPPSSPTGGAVGSATYIGSLTKPTETGPANGPTTCAIDSNGAAWCWGYNFNGELGNGTSVYPSYTAVNPTGLTSGVTAITTGSTFTCAIQSGAAKCWGAGTSGQLGNGSTTQFTTPQQVTGLTSGVTAIAAGGNFACAIQSGAVKCWGNSSSGQLGFGGTAAKTTPNAVSSPMTSGVVSLAAGNTSVCAVTSAGAVYCWGSGGSGQMGNGTTTASNLSPVATSLTSGVTSIAAGTSQVCAVQSGAALCWGNNASGQLGINSTISSSTPYNPTGLTSGVTAVSAGNTNSCAIQSGAAYCWGTNGQGQIGNGTTTQSKVPTAVSGFSSGVTAISTGYLTSCAVKSTLLYCWGDNAFGQFGNNSVTASSTPTGMHEPTSNLAITWSSAVPNYPNGLAGVPYNSYTVTATATGSTITCSATAPATTCTLSNMSSFSSYAITITGTHAGGTSTAATINSGYTIL